MEIYVNIIPCASLPLNNLQKYTYQAPISSHLRPGQIVHINMHGRLIYGVVDSISADTPDEMIKYKKIGNIVTSGPLFTARQMELAEWISRYYLAPLGTVMKAMLPQLPKRLQNLPFFIDKNYKYSHKALHVSGSQKNRLAEYADHLAPVIKNNGQALIIFPEIAPLIQAEDILNSLFPGKIGIIHSKISAGKYFKEWTALLGGESRIIIGTRQAVFLPWQNIGLAAVDDESNPAHKQWDMKPYYDARTVTSYLAHQTGCRLLIGSASPSISAYHKIQSSAMQKSTQKYYTHKRLPILADMRAEQRQGNLSLLSFTARKMLDTVLSRQEKAFIFVNRKGQENIFLCRDCGFVSSCPNCSANLALYPGNMLKCLHCSYKTSTPLFCPRCRSHRINGFGLGTSKVLFEMKRLFPDKNIGLLDGDSAQNLSSLKKTYQKYETGQFDILIGTQMAISWQPHGLSLVIIPDFDSRLNFPDWQNKERMHILLSEICSIESADAVIQTYNPEHAVFSNLADEKKFYQEELQIRQENNYPPFSQFIKISAKSPENSKAKADLMEFYNKLIGTNLDPMMEIKAPAPAAMKKVGNKHIWKMIIKCQPFIKEEHRKTIKLALPDHLYIDIEPINLL